MSLDQVFVECCGCRMEGVYSSRVEAQADGWVKIGRAIWTCEDCAAEAREEMQAAYDEKHPALSDPWWAFA